MTISEPDGVVTMPDADNIGRFSRRWSRMYTKLYEGHFAVESLADDAEMSLRMDIKDYGNDPIRFLKEASGRLERIRNNPLFLPLYDWGDEDRFIRELRFSYVQRYRPRQRGIDLAISAYKDLVHTFRNGDSVGGNLDEELIRNYIRNIYDSSFTDLIPLANASQISADRPEIIHRLNEMRAYVNEHINTLAAQIAKRGTVNRLKLRPRSVLQRIVSLTDDVFSLGNNK